MKPKFLRSSLRQAVNMACVVSILVLFLPSSSVSTNNHQDVHKTFIDDQTESSGCCSAYDLYGIDNSKGAAVIVRPDQCKPYFMNVIARLI